MCRDCGRSPPSTWSPARRDVDADVRAQKDALRQELLRRLKAQSPEERLRRSQSLIERVLQLPEFQGARVMLGYSALPYEVETAALLDAALASGKHVALPRVITESNTLVAYAIRHRVHDLEPGPYGVRQPRMTPESRVPLESVDLALVPGVGFDRAGRRLGHGYGYYDRWLRQLPAQTPRIGLAFACQVVERIPATADDMPVTAVLTA